MSMTNRINELEQKLKKLEAENQALKEKNTEQDFHNNPLFQELFQNTRNVCFIYTAINQGQDFLISAINPAFEHIEQLERAPLIGKKASEVLIDMGSDFIEVLRHVNETGKKEVFRFFYQRGDVDYFRENDVFRLKPGVVISVYEDTSSLKAKEADLINSEARYKALADATNEAVFFMVDAKCIDCNSMAIKMFGYEREEAIGKHALTIIDEASHKDTLEKLKSNYTKPYLSIGVHKDGHRFPIRIHGRVFQYKGRNTRVTTMRDMSDVMEREQDLKNSEARFKVLADSTTEAVWFSVDFKCTDFNKTALEMFAYEPEEIYGQNALRIIDKADHAKVIQNIQKDIAEPYEVMGVRKDGSRFPIRIQGKNFIYRGEKLRISTMRDITEEKARQKELLASEKKFRIYFEENHAVHLQIDPESKQIIDANRAALQFYGYTKEEILSKKIYDLNTLPLLEVDALVKRASAKDQNSFSFPHRLKNGEIRDVQVYSSPIEVDGRKTLFSIIHDVTEGKKAADELRKSEARFRAYFENNTAAMLQVNPKTKQIEKANRAALAFYGYTMEQLKKLTVYDINIMPKAEIDSNMEKIMAMPAKEFIFQHRLANGKTKEVEVNISPVFTDNEQLLFLTIYDVSERERNKHALEKSEKNLLEAQNIAKIGNWEVDYVTKSMFWSDTIYRIFEIETKKPLKKGDYNPIVHPDDLEALRKSFGDALKNKKAYRSIHRIITPSGKIKYVQENGYALYDEKGKIIRVIGTTQDITEQKNAELSLNRSQKNLKEAQRIAKVGHFEHVFNTKKIYWSEEISRIFGFDHEKTKPNYEDYKRQIHSDDYDSMFEKFNQAKKEKRGYTLSYRIKSLSGEVKYLEEKGYFELDKKSKAYKVIGTMQDITSSYLIKKDLEESKRKLAEINQSLETRIKDALANSRAQDHMLIQQSRQAVLGEMIGNIAHQWRQPLNEISLLINDLEDAYSFGTLSKEYFEKTIEVVYDRLIYMSDTISDFSKMHTDDFKSEDFNLKEIIEKLIDFTAASNKENKIRIRLLAEGNFEMRGYPNMISHVLLNLLNNSRDIFIERHIRAPKIWIKLEQKDEEYCIRVLDNGKGIKQEVVGKIFDPYFTSKDSTKGSGLGLFMAKQMIEEQMKGKISVKNMREGAEFKICIPLRKG